MNRSNSPESEDFSDLEIENEENEENGENEENEKNEENEENEEKLSEVSKVEKLMMAAGAKLNFECACAVEKIISSVGPNEENYKWLLERLFKSLNPEFNSSGKVGQLREWLNFSNQQKSHDDLEMLKLFLDTVIMIESKKKV